MDKATLCAQKQTTASSPLISFSNYIFIHILQYNNGEKSKTKKKQKTKQNKSGQIKSPTSIVRKNTHI